MSTPFNPRVGGKISRKEADQWIQNFENERADKEKDTKSVFFGKEFLLEVLATEGAAGITFFFAKKPSEIAQKEVLDLVLVPRAEDGTLLWPTITEGKDASGNGAYDKSNICPPDC